VGADLSDADLTATSLKTANLTRANLTGANGLVKDGSELARRAIEKGVAFVPGAPFFANNPDTTAIRLSFATADVDKINEGIARLGQAL
jgi:DNA-binding transcriptional MocR family regulator